MYCRMKGKLQRILTMQVICLLLSTISSTTTASILPTPDIQAVPIIHTYQNEFDWWDSDPWPDGWGPCPYTQIHDYWYIQNGPSIFPDSVDPYYDSIVLSLVAGTDKKFVVDLPTGADSIEFHASVWMSIYVNDEYIEHPSPPAIMPDSQSVTFFGPSGETILTLQDSVEVFVAESESGDGFSNIIVGDIFLDIAEDFEFSRIEFACHYNGEIPYPLYEGQEYGFKGTSMYAFSYTDIGPLPDLPVLSIVPVPEPGSVLLFGLGCFMLNRSFRMRNYASP